jgi:predicted ABC-class ATPase
MSALQGVCLHCLSMGDLLQLLARADSAAHLSDEVANDVSELREEVARREGGK